MRRRYSLRVRITAAFAVLFALGALVLIAVAYLIVTGSTGTPVSDSAVKDQTKMARPLPEARGRHLPDSITVLLNPRRAGTVSFDAVQAAQVDQSRSEHRRILWLFAAALAAVVALALVGGWVVAGRALAPLRRITTTAREVSGDTLGARVGLRGPPDELRELAETFDAMLARLDESFVAQRRFVADASHELRTPLAVARTEAEVALADGDASAAELRDSLRHVHATMLRAGDLVEALLAMARADVGPGLLAPVEMGGLVRDCAADRAAAAAAAGVTLDLADVPAEAYATGEETLLRAAVDNLLANSIAYDERGGRVRVSLARRDDDLLLTVANGGPPVDPGIVDDLFEPFVRAEASRSRRSGGAGLGLAIVRAVVLAHQGHLEASAPESGGLTVSISLPAASAVPPDERGRPRASAAQRWV